MEALRASASTFQDDLLDENCSSSSSFSNMTQAFSQRISELQQLVCFRVEDSVKHIFVRDIQGIEASVRALEQLFDELRQRTQQEMASVPKARALLQAAELQQQHLQQISSNLPQHLPSTCPAPAAAPAAAAAAHQQGAAVKQQGAAGTAVLGVRGATSTAAAADDARGSKAADKRRKDGPAAARPAPAAAPRWYVTAAELASVPSYIKGRLTLEKVNAAVDELAGFAEACAKAMASVARNQLARVGAEERIRLQELYHSIANKDAAKGRFWFLENDLRAGTAVKMDKSGKSMLMLLRHLGRLQEVRAVLESMGSVTAYVLQAQA
uniref:Spindle and kinetochore-associated protein 1 n=1 Tax=Tetradesmus obliquus TaxID=3088 RepID=A0A383VKE4_TETOB|eukprot:jgi/Sobl393_1/19442/SZX66008.1